MDKNSKGMGTASNEQRPPSRSVLAIVSFTAANLSLAGLLFGALAPGVVYLFPLFVVALITGHLARRKFKARPGAHSNEAMATYGLAVGYLGLFLSILVIAAMAFGLAGAGSGLGSV